jgi:hypothetical protein
MAARFMKIQLLRFSGSATTVYHSAIEGGDPETSPFRKDEIFNDPVASAPTPNSIEKEIG